MPPPTLYSTVLNTTVEHILSPRDTLELYVLNSSTQQALACGSDFVFNTCPGICPNPDIMGIGVRVAFYIQSGLNALLVVFSPTDSVATTWSGTLLTTALIIAAFVLKAKNSLTLYHATLVLNFATLSCISSLAAAPTLPIWRLTPQEYYQREFARRALTLPEDDGHRDQNLILGIFDMSTRKKELRAAQKRGRVVLAFAIMIQVALQWTWGVFLFVSPTGYSQPECNGNTTLNFIVKSFNVSDINTYQPFNNTNTRQIEHAPHYKEYFLWALWISMNLTVTLFLAILLAVSSPERSLPEVPSTTAPGSRGSGLSSTPIISALYQIALRSVTLSLRRLLLLALNFFTVVLWAMFIYASEKQRGSNNVFDGENDFGGFGQITALLVSLAPLWSLSVALYKYPALRRRLRRFEEHMYGFQQNLNLSTEDLRRRTSRAFMPTADVYPLQDLRSARSDQPLLSPDMSPPDMRRRTLVPMPMPDAEPYPANDTHSPRSDDAFLGEEAHAWSRPRPAIHVSSDDDDMDMDMDIADGRYAQRRAPDTALPWPDVPDVHRRTTHWRNVSS